VIDLSVIERGAAGGATAQSWRGTGRMWQENGLCAR
jgi:hypothetical protein